MLQTDEQKSQYTPGLY